MYPQHEPDHGCPLKVEVTVKLPVSIFLTAHFSASVPTISNSKLMFRRFFIRHFFPCVNIKGSLNFKGILVCKRRHKSYFISTISIIKTIYCFLLIFTAKSTFDPLVTKWISLPLDRLWSLQKYPIFLLFLHNLISLFLSPSPF